MPCRFINARTLGSGLSAPYFPSLMYFFSFSAIALALSSDIFSLSPALYKTNSRHVYGVL